MKFSEICTFAVIYAAYMAARRGKRSRAATAHYEVRLLENIVNLVYILKTKIYRPGVFRVFYVYEPKKRLVQAPAFVDKVVQHAIVDNLLYDRITRSFILDNYASQKNKGLHFGLDRLKGFFTDYWNKHHTAEGWVLKCDVRHFFASINHDKLKEKLKKLTLSLLFMTCFASILTALTACRWGIRHHSSLPSCSWMTLTTSSRNSSTSNTMAVTWMTFSSSTRTRNTCNSASGKYGPTWIAWGWN